MATSHASDLLVLITSNATLNTPSVGKDGIRWGPEVFGKGRVYEDTRGQQYQSTRLFCFSVVTSAYADGSEVDLVRYQYRHQVGIFGCDAARVYGDKPLSLQPGNDSAPHIVEHHQPPSQYVVGHLVNRELFVNVLDLIAEDGAFRDYDVIVKADPDAVFVPPRLRTSLSARRPSGEAWYYANCNSSKVGYPTMQGPLEVFSKGMLEKFSNVSARASDCQMTPAEIMMAGEDMFIDRCMTWIGGHRLLDLNLMRDEFCGWDHEAHCSAQKLPAYHPFKDVHSWSECLNGTLA